MRILKINNLRYPTQPIERTGTMQREPRVSLDPTSPHTSEALALLPLNLLPIVKEQLWLSFNCTPQKQFERSRFFLSRGRSSLLATPNGIQSPLECSRSRTSTIFAIGLEALDAIKAKRGVLPALV